MTLERKSMSVKRRETLMDMKRMLMQNFIRSLGARFSSTKLRMTLLKMICRVRPSYSSS